MRETTVEQALREGVEALGGTCEKFVSPGKRGVPDRIVSWPEDHDNSDQGEHAPFRPLTEYVETKAPSGKLEPWQERDHARRRAMGFEVYVLWNVYEVEKYLRSRGKK